MPIEDLAVNIVWMVVRFYLVVYGALALLAAVAAVRAHLGRRMLLDVLHSEIEQYLRTNPVDAGG